MGGMAYDPDGDPDALDLNDPDAVSDYLDNPTVKALREDLGRAFAALPPGEQIDELAVELLRLMDMRDELVAAMETIPVAEPGVDPRPALLESIDDMITRIRARIAELHDRPSV